MCQLTQLHYKFCDCVGTPTRTPCPKPASSCDALLSSATPTPVVLHCYCPQHSNAGFLSERKALSRSRSNSRPSRPPAAGNRPNILRRWSSRRLEIPERPASVAGVIEENESSPGISRDSGGEDKKPPLADQTLTRAKPGSKTVRYLRPVSVLMFNFGFDDKDKPKQERPGMEKDTEIVRPIPRRPVSALPRSHSAMGRPQSAGAGAVILKDPELLRRRSRLMTGESVVHPGSLTPGRRRTSRMVEMGLEKDKERFDGSITPRDDTGFETKDKRPLATGETQEPKTFETILRRTASEKDKDGLARRHGDWEGYVRKQKERVESWKARSRLRKKDKGEKGASADGECRVM